MTRPVVPGGALTRTERGIDVCAPVHDALLVEAAEPDIDPVVASPAGAWGQMLDHMLVTRNLLAHYRGSEIHDEILHDESIAFAVDRKYPESDHAPVVATFEFDLITPSQLDHRQCCPAQTRSLVRRDGACR